MQKKGKKVKTLEDRPVITETLHPYYQAWNLLHPRRIVNETGAQPLPMSDIIAVAELYCDDDKDDIIDFVAIISTAEAALLNELAEERKKQIEAAKRRNSLRR